MPESDLFRRVQSLEEQIDDLRADKQELQAGFIALNRDFEGFKQMVSGMAAEWLNNWRMAAMEINKLKEPESQIIVPKLN